MSSMKLQISLPGEPDLTETVTCIKSINSGKQIVLKVYSPSARQNYALKLFPKNLFGANQFKKEKLMFKLSHINIIQQIPAACVDDRFWTSMTEFAKYGDFFDLVTKGHLNSEVLMRTYFHQLINGLEYIHSQGIAHLDLKLENIMLGEDFQLKIIDFDQAQKASDKIITSGGTVAYRAPEVIKGTCSIMRAADIYAAGVILYAFKAKEFPFVEKIDDINDHRSYQCFVKENTYFWKMKAYLKKYKAFFSQDLIDLLNGMLHENPVKRFTIKEIKESRWFKGPVLNEKALVREMIYKLEPSMSTKNLRKSLRVETKLPSIYGVGKEIKSCRAIL